MIANCRIHEKNIPLLEDLLEDSIDIVNFYPNIVDYFSEEKDKELFYGLNEVKRIFGKEFHTCRLVGYCDALMKYGSLGYFVKLEALKNVLGNKIGLLSFRGLSEMIDSDCYGAEDFVEVSNRIKDIFGEEITPWNLKEVMASLYDYDSKKREKVLLNLEKLKDVLKEDFFKSISFVIDELGQFDFSDLDKLSKFKDIEGEAYNQYSIAYYLDSLSTFPIETLEKYSKLREIITAPSEIDLFYAIRVLNQCDDRIFFRTREFIEKIGIDKFSSYDLESFGIMEDCFEFSDDVDGISVQYADGIRGSQNREEIVSYISGRLEGRLFYNREDAQYSLSSIDDIQDLRILSLVKGYVDFFENQENVDMIGCMIGEDFEDPYSEHGGVVLYLEDKSEYEFVEWDTRQLEDKKVENNSSYKTPLIIKYIKQVGMFHFHATEDDCSGFAGPSGSDQKRSNYLGDLCHIEAFNKINRYKVDCVATKINGSYNVHVYFCDPGDCDKIKVVNLGIRVPRDARTA